MSKIAFLFPGQGAQSVGMGTSLQDFPPAQALFRQASDLLGYDLAEVCVRGPAERLNSTVVSQPALFVTSLAALEKLKHDAPEVVASCAGAAGLSLGEFTALTFAGAMDFPTGLRVVKARGEAMQAAADEHASGMLSLLGVDLELAEKICQEARAAGGVLQVANLLCPGNIVISGDRACCERARTLAEEAGATKVIPLAVAGAFHTSLMQSAVEKLRAALANAELQPPRVPVYANVNAAPHGDPAQIRDSLLAQVVSPVQWEASMRKLLAEGFDAFYEVGPGRVLRGLLKRVQRKAEMHGTLD